MASIINYTFNDKKLKNPDGTLPIPLPADTTLVDGPGSFQGQNLPRSASLGVPGFVKVDVSAARIVNESRFHVQIVFNLDTIFVGSQLLAGSDRLPFRLELSGEQSSIKLVASVRSSSAVGWRSTERYSCPDIQAAQWHVADLVYDVDTLTIYLDGVAVGCHGFGPNGNLEIAQDSKTVTIGGQDAGSRFHGKIAAFKLEADIPDDLETLADQQRFTAQWYITSKVETNRLAFDSGSPTGEPSFSSSTLTWSQPYSRGLIMYHSAASSAFEMHGFIGSRYNQLDANVKSALGYLVSDEISSESANGRKSVFQGGAIYWSSATGAFEVVGQLYLGYESTGEAGSWGFPLGAAEKIAAGVSQRMQTSTWYYKDGAASAHDVSGNILKSFLATGGVSHWGYPISGETLVKGTSTRNASLSEFEGGSCYSSRTTGAHFTYGDIRAKWRDLGGPVSALGLPTTDEIDIPGTGGRMNGFEHGVIVWYGSWSTIKVVHPFKIFIGNFNTSETEGFGQGQNDLYFMATINKGNSTVFRQRYPGSGDFGDRNNRDVNIEFPAILTPDPVAAFTLIVDVWDSDQGAPFGGGDDHLGTWVKVLDASNAWGLNEHDGIFNSGRISLVNNISAAVHPQVDLRFLTEVDMFWGKTAFNRKTEVINYATYAEAFRDVDSEPELHDPLDWLDKLFYELVVKHLAKGGNCFGMSLEAIYARKGLSLFSLPIGRFGDWDVLVPTFNVKHQYQVGAASIWFFVGEFLSGKTHNPVDVFNKTRDDFFSGNQPVLCLAQNFDFSGAPHCVLPVGWNSSVTPWTMTIHDPIFPDQLRTLTVNSSNNTFNYQGGSNYSGGQWSGGRLYYLPYSVLCRAPRTPVWDAILLILAATVVILGDDAESASITDANGADLSAHGSVATRNLQAGRHLDGYFTKAPVMMGEDLPGTMLFTRGNQAPTSSILPMHPGLSATLHALGINPVITVSATGDLHGLEARLIPFLPANDFKHKIRGKAGGGTHQQIVKHGSTQFSITSPIAAGEAAHVEAKSLGTINAQISFTHSSGKSHEIAIMHRIGMTRDSVEMKFNLTTSAAGTIVLSPRPGMGLVDLLPGTTKLTSAKLAVTTSFAKSQHRGPVTHEFDLAHPTADAAGLSGPIRLKIPAAGGLPADNATVTIANLDTTAASRRILTSRLVPGTVVTQPGGLSSGALGSLSHVLHPQIPHILGSLGRGGGGL